MNGLVIEQPGEPSDLSARELPLPEPGAGEVLLKIATAAVNRSDTLNVRGIPLTTFPRVPGRDFAGTAVAGPAELIGESFWGTGSGDLGFTRDGSHAENLVVPVSALVPLPRALTLREAGAAGLSYLTALDGLTQARSEEADSVLVTGAAGGVGSAALAIARWQGKQAIAAVLDEAEAERVRAVAPQAPVVITAEEELAAAVVELTDGRGVDIVYDTVGTALLAPGLSCLARGGRFVAITAPPGVEVPFDLFSFYRREATLLSENTTRSDSSWCADLLKTLLPGFESGDLPAPAISEDFGLAEAAAAYAAVEQGRPGRVVFSFA